MLQKTAGTYRSTNDFPEVLTRFSGKRQRCVTTSICQPHLRQRARKNCSPPPIHDCRSNVCIQHHFCQTGLKCPRSRGILPSPMHQIPAVKQKVGVIKGDQMTTRKMLTRKHTSRSSTKQASTVPRLRIPRFRSEVV